MSNVSKILDWAGFRTMAAWFADTIHNLWSEEKDSFISDIEDNVNSKVFFVWVGTENNVDMLCNFGVDGETYTLGEWTVTSGGDVYTSDQVDGHNVQVKYSINTTYVGGEPI